MQKTSFCFFDKTQAKDVLPQMYDILFSNMSKIAPTGNNYEEDKQVWLSYMASFPENGQEIILMYVDETLAGYFQYRIIQDTMLIEEIEISPDYQRTLLFYSFLKFAVRAVPKNVLHVEALIHKHNSNSQAIARKLGMQIVGENRNGRSWRYAGELKQFSRYLKISV